MELGGGLYILEDCKDPWICLDQKISHLKEIVDTKEQQISLQKENNIFGMEYVFKSHKDYGDIRYVVLDRGTELSQMTVYEPVNLIFDNSRWESDVLEVGYCMKGSTRLKMYPQGKEVTIKEGDIFIYTAKNQVDVFDFHYHPGAFMSISVDSQIIKRTINPEWKGKVDSQWKEGLKDYLKEESLLVVRGNATIKNLAEELHNLYPNDLLSHMQVKFKAMHFMGELIDRIRDMVFMNSNSRWNLVKRCKRMIENNLTRQIGVEDYARGLNVSVHTLQKYFKEVTGYTVHRYIVSQRLQKAKQLLLESDLSILEITNAIGYENPSKFAHSFKQHYKITPYRYRKQALL